jgi:Tfp pilus assembly protein PilN
MPRRSAIDFAPGTRPRALLCAPLSAWFALLAAAVLLLAAAIALLDLVRQQHQREAELAAASRGIQTARTARPAPPAAIPATQAEAANLAISQLNLPWRQLFDAVAAATPKQVALLALEPDAQKHMLRGTAESKNSAGMLAYLAALKQQLPFSSVLLTRHEINRQDVNRPIRFQFAAHWHAELPEREGTQ